MCVCVCVCVCVVVKILIWILRSYDFTIPPSQNDSDICDCSGSYDFNDPKRP